MSAAFWWACHLARLDFDGLTPGSAPTLAGDLGLDAARAAGRTTWSVRHGRARCRRRAPRRRRPCQARRCCRPALGRPRPAGRRGPQLGKVGGKCPRDHGTAGRRDLLRATQGGEPVPWTYPKRAQEDRVSTTSTAPASTAPTEALVLTDIAAAKVAELLEQEGNPELVLRVAVRPGGCSGFSYEMFFDTEMADDDLQSTYRRRQGRRRPRERLSARWAPPSITRTGSRAPASRSTTPTPAGPAAAASRSAEPAPGRQVTWPAAAGGLPASALQAPERGAVSDDQPIGPYSPVVEAGPWLVVSGQLGVRGRCPGPRRCRRSRRLRRSPTWRPCWPSTALRLTDVVKTTVFMTDIS